jgi:chemotaxis protein methyltransferase CheR
MDKLENFEVTLLLSAIEHRWGYDFNGYARAFIKRRIRRTLNRCHLQHVSELIPRVLHEPAFIQGLVQDISIPVTEMFRDPPIWKALREQIFPMLRTWPYFKIWHAGCATGNEVYSMAIMLEEAGLLKRATIYATDFNNDVLQKAREGIYPLNEMQAASRNYLKAGGQHSLNLYYHAQGSGAQINASLRESIVWANHNLTVDRVFGEMNLILCRNVLIYFSKPLQNHALELFTASLTDGGYLCLGSKESLDFSSVSQCYAPTALKERIYRRLHCDCVEPEGFKSQRMNVRERFSGLEPSGQNPPGVLAIGCSLGGLKALQTLLPGLPASFPLPVLITQHIAASPASAMAEVLQKDCALAVQEAKVGEKIQAGCIYLAPADYHLLLNDDWTLALSSEEKDHYARPSINLMFESVAEVCGSQSIGMLLTGANDDGARGLGLIKAAGGYTMVQDPKNAEAPAMPLAALRIIRPDSLLPISSMAVAVTTRARLIGAHPCL